ncbi:protein SDA1 homolog [Harpegnathos saltator]|uniref:Protein SDA1 n=1 Tax=Harpegnathos saltator TaxID=610380 RepID=E2BGG3_HARSA|nr:protein SDA1 homolog [Harpegnathos saltator]EFN85212.1 Protein SDA1-like protein [Harpegnathos saltator]
MVRHNNQLPHNLPQLQNLIKRDPESYKEEFLQQYQHYKSTLEVFHLEPTQFNKSLDDLITFLAQVAHCYIEDLNTYPQEIVDILRTHNTILDNEMRMTFCKALIQLRNKSLLEPTALLSLFFELLKCQDKALRQFLQTHIITDIKNINIKRKNAKVNTVLQNFMFSMLKDSNAKAVKMSIDIMIELYNKNVWNDAKTVNVIATGCFSKITKVAVASIKFFLGHDSEEKESDDSDSDNEPNIREVIMANKVNKKTKKREKQLKKVKQLFVKAKKKKSKAPQYNFSALHLIHDPQDFAEKLFKQIEKNNDRFEIKLMTLDIVSRLIGLHNLFLFNFYPYIQRFLQPHQREVTKLLQFIAQASHELIPPDVLEPVLKTLVNNFVTERNSADVMAIGLNTVREICTRCPLAMNRDLLEDLTQYKQYKERSVMMSARSLIGTFRRIMPDLLHRKDRGRPTEVNIAIEASKYGEVRASEFVPGADVLFGKHIEETDHSDSEDNEWINVSHNSDEEVNDEKSIVDADQSIESSASDDDDDDNDDYYDDDDDDDDDKEQGKNNKNGDDDFTFYNEKDSIKNDCGNNNEKRETDKTLRKKNVLTKQQKKARKLKKTKQNTEQNTELIAERKIKASLISTERLFTDEDFRKIDIALVKQEVTYANRGVKRVHDQIETVKQNGELVKLCDIENIYKKRKHDKAARLESVKKGQEEREKFGYKDGRQNPLCSKTNREKRKGKIFQMLKHKLKGKAKRSFKNKQIALRNHLLKQRKMR